LHANSIQTDGGVAFACSGFVSTALAVASGASSASDVGGTGLRSVSAGYCGRV